MPDDFEKRYAEAKKRAEDTSIELAESMGHVPYGTVRKNQMEWEALEKERLDRAEAAKSGIAKKDPLAK